MTQREGGFVVCTGNPITPATPLSRVQRFIALTLMGWEARRMGKDAERGFDWVALPVIATVAHLIDQAHHVQVDAGGEIALVAQAPVVRVEPLLPFGSSARANAWRFACRVPGTFVCATSSTSTHSGWRAR